MIKIPRSKWLRGLTGSKLAKDGQRCFEGFLVESFDGMTAEKLESFNQFSKEDNKAFMDFINKDGRLARLEDRVAIVRINDDEEMSETEREKLLMKKADELGFDVQFVD